MPACAGCSAADGWIELLRTLLKLGVVGGALWLALDLAALQAALHQPPGRCPAVIGRGVLRLLVVALGAFGGHRGAGRVVVRWRHLRQMRMSREDLRQEMREPKATRR